MDNNENRPSNGGNKKNEDNKKKQKLMMFGIAALITLLLVTMFSSVVQSSSRKEIKYSEFLEMLEDNKVDEVQITNSGTILIYPKDKKYWWERNLPTGRWR